MGKKRKAAARKVQTEEEKPKVVVKHETSEEEESESDEEILEIEESESEEEEEEDDDDSEDEEEEEEEEEEAEEDEESKKETLRKLLEPFGKDQIIEFLKEAALKDRSILARITQTADSDPAHRKIFVHGLAWDATTEQVLSVFKQYGDIEECKAVTDKVTGRSKGYGFVLFKTQRSARKALKEPQKKIGSRLISCQLASAGHVTGNHPAVPDPAGRKIFVGNVGPHVNPDMLRLYFAKFGEIEEGPLGLDHVTGKFKGFAIFVYKTVEGCKKALEEPAKVFEGSQLQCRRAVEGQRANKNHTSLPTTASSGSGNLQQSDITNMNYGVGVGASPGFYASNVNPAAGFMFGQNPGIGLPNPMLISAFHQNGISPSIGATAQSLGMSGNYGINSVSPSVIGYYGSQLALQGLGAYQNAQLGPSSVGSTPAVATRQQPGFGSVGTNFPSYFGR